MARHFGGMDIIVNGARVLRVFAQDGFEHRHCLNRRIMVAPPFGCDQRLGGDQADVGRVGGIHLQ